jgi:Undecaprenyl-phosphate glucose phosphotransferase
VNKNHKYFLGIYYRIIDLIALNTAIVLAVYVRFGNDETYGFLENKYLTLLIFLNLSWVIISHSQKIYNIFSFSSRKRYFFRVVMVIVLEVIITVSYNGLIKTYYSRLFLMYTFLSFPAFMLIGRFIINANYKAYLSKKFHKNYIVLVGESFSMRDVQSFLNEDSIDNDFQKVHHIKEKDNLISELKRLKEKAPISEIYINLSQINEELKEALSAYCDNNFIRLRLVLDWQKISSKHIETRKFNHTTVLNVPLTPLDDPSNVLLKRGFDILFSSIIILAIISWLFPILAIIIKLTSKGKVFFIQKRTGIDNKEFYCWKFRSMRENDDADKIQATKEDDRITAIGRFLRRSSLDELPQFFNVFKGEMSIVGPRPHMLKHTEEYSKQTDNFMNRHAIKPGITGLAQIKGYRGEIDDSNLLIHRIRLDRFYVNNWSLYIDVKIVIYTVLVIFKDHK